MSEKDIEHLQKLNQNNSQSYKFPKYEDVDFRCPHCNIHSKQNWCSVCVDNIDSFINELDFYLKGRYDSIIFGNHEIQDISEKICNKIFDIWKKNFIIPSTKIASCDSCQKFSIWIDREMIYSLSSTAPLPIEEMPQSVKELYNEARDIFNKSPRGACALLRLAVETLIKELGEDTENLNKAIGNLVKKGLPEDIQKALDIIRVTGNKAVHPGKISKEDDSQTVESLFILVNLICEKMITDKNKLKFMYDSLPKNQKKAINKRDSKTQKR